MGKWLMIVSSLMDMSVLKFLFGGFTKAHNLYVEVQFIPGKRMIEIQTDGFIFDTVDTCIACLPGVITNR